MGFHNFSVILGEAGAPAQPAAQQQQPPGWTSFVPLMLFVVIIYFAFFRPQQKRAKEQQEMLKSVKSGDKIMTTGGIIATVITVKEKSISVRSADSKMEITKNAIAEILERSGESNDSGERAAKEGQPAKS